jgi:glycosyltransferase involved in cell wall biosynthesis
MMAVECEANYVVVSPVKDEERYVETTIQSVIGQTRRPKRWVIVDDGSQDGTPGILARYAEKNPWITVVRVERDGERRLGVAEVCAFDRGYRLISELPHDFVVKLDCDVELPAGYFAELIARFEADHTLGIASGLYLEDRGLGWEPIGMPEYHAAGASKVIRATCFRQIGGFIFCPGWDTVDEIKARALGWKTRHYGELTFRHLKPEGSASGHLKIAAMCGEIDYRTGLTTAFFALKVFHRMAMGKPRLLAGLAMLYGFSRALLLRKPKLVSAAEQALYRQMLTGRMRRGIQRVGDGLRRKALA